jgi:hypothetical protein
LLRVSGLSTPWLWLMAETGCNINFLSNFMYKHNPHHFYGLWWYIAMLKLGRVSSHPVFNFTGFWYWKQFYAFFMYTITI